MTPGIEEDLVIIIIIQCRSDCMQTLSKIGVHEEIFDVVARFDCYNLCSNSSLLKVRSK